MNVDHVEEDVIPTDFSIEDRLDQIFSRQRALCHKYTPIEQANGLRHTTQVPVNLDDRFGQAQLKDMFWRVTEEITEACAALEDHPDLPTHALEELSDALHFLIEAYILADISPQDLWEVSGTCKLEEMVSRATAKASNRQEILILAYNVVHLLGCAGNCLKQRPWKRTHQLVDHEAFKGHLRLAIVPLLGMFTSLGADHQAIFRIYWKKSEVNGFRIRSNY